jgi:hypothetical protein
MEDIRRPSVQPEQPEQPELARYEALLGAMTRLVRAPEAPGAVAEDAQGWLGEGGLGPGDAAQLAAFGPRRLLVYRRHVRRTLVRAIRQVIPRTAARMGDAFAVWVDRWIAEESPRSQYFRDVAFELVAWAAPRWADDASLPSYLGDLARHELVEFEVAAAPDDAIQPPGGEIALDRGVRFAASARLRRYEHPVHRLEGALDARDVPPRQPAALLVYRDAEQDVRFLELTPLAAGILERLLRREPLGEAVVRACEAQGAAVDATVTASTAALLQDLLERGAILGGEAW